METEEALRQQKEWEDFRSLAVAAVRTGFTPEYIRGEYCERLLQVMVYPAFSAVTGWEIFRIKAAGANPLARFVVNRTRWLQQEDVHKFYHPVERLTMLRLKYLKRLSPTLMFLTQPIEETNATDIEEMMVQLASFSVPLIITDKHFGLDGTTYEIGLGDFWAGLRLHWWGEAPREWQPLQEIVTSVIGNLENRLNCADAGDNPL